MVIPFRAGLLGSSGVGWRLGTGPAVRSGWLAGMRRGGAQLLQAGDELHHAGETAALAGRIGWPDRARQPSVARPDDVDQDLHAPSMLRAETSVPRCNA